ncbi:MAG: argininosuccinate lyase [Mycoplasmataceae bacterium]|nr:argininosuccinate lyase [Mycoplasmataceae bacterium]
MGTKLWKGRFVANLNPQADDFNSSLRFDKKMYVEDIDGSIAHCSMLSKQKIIPSKDANKIISELKKIKSDIASGVLEISDAEDIHMYVETVLTKRIGDVGKKLHTGRSRNDQVAVDTRLFIKKSEQEIINKLIALIKTINALAEANLDVIMPAFTHLQKAQPTTLAHWLMAYNEMFYRDLQRFKSSLKRTDYCPLGAGALCGTTYNIDRKYTAELLGFKDITPNSLDAVSDRDYVLEYLFDISTTMMHLSRLNEEIILFVSNDYQYAVLSDEFSTGSSIMPQKKNPDINELIRGKTGRAYGNLFALMTVMKAQPLAYNKDMQEDKETIFDSQDTINVCLDLINKFLPSMKFNKQILLEKANKGHMAATDVADYLAKKNVPFRDAYQLVGQIVLYCEENKKTFATMTIEDYRKFSPLFNDDIFNVISLQTLIDARDVIGGPAKKQVQNEIARMKKKISD